MRTMAQPEAYIGGAGSLFDEEGKLINESTKEFLHTWMNSFEEWIYSNVKK